MIILSLKDNGVSLIRETGFYSNVTGPEFEYPGWVLKTLCPVCKKVSVFTLKKKIFPKLCVNNFKEFLSGKMVQCDHCLKILECE